jgi:hypothetical protein
VFEAGREGAKIVGKLSQKILNYNYYDYGDTKC